MHSMTAAAPKCCKTSLRILAWAQNAILVGHDRLRRVTRPSSTGSGSAGGQAQGRALAGLVPIRRQHETLDLAQPMPVVDEVSYLSSCSGCTSSAVSGTAIKLPVLVTSRRRPIRDGYRERIAGLDSGQRVHLAFGDEHRGLTRLYGRSSSTSALKNVLRAPERCQTAYCRPVAHPVLGVHLFPTVDVGNTRILPPASATGLAPS